MDILWLWCNHSNVMQLLLRVYSGVRRKFSWGFHSVAYGGRLYLVCAVCDVTIRRHIHVSKPTFCEVCWPQWRSSVACRPWILPILPPPPHSYTGQHSITAKIFLWTLLAVQKSQCVLCMLMRQECHCNKYISTGFGLLTFCKARHAIEA